MKQSVPRKAALAACALCCGLWWQALAVEAASSVQFGNASSEAEAELVPEDSITGTNAGGFSWRRIGLSGKLFVTLDCDPDAQNYLTLKLCGSDHNNGLLYLVKVDGKDTKEKYGTSNPEIDRLSGGTVSPGKFCYATVMIPQELTKGKKKVTLELRSTGQINPYNTDKKKQTARQKEPSRAIYAAYITQDPCPAFPEEIAEPEIAARAADAPPMTSPDGLSQKEHVQKEANKALQYIMDWQCFGPVWQKKIEEGTVPRFVYGAVPFRGIKARTGWDEGDWKYELGKRAVVMQNDSQFEALEFYAQGYVQPWSKHYKDPELLERIAAGLDFFTVAQGNNGGFSDDGHKKDWIGAPYRQKSTSPLSGLGDRWMGKALVTVYDDMKARDMLDVLVDHDDDPKTPLLTRREAWAQMFAANREYMAKIERGHAPNQDLGQIQAMFWDDKALALLSPSEAWPKKTIKSYIASAAGLRKDIYGGYWFSEKGIALEPNGTSGGGYTGDYGPHNVDFLAKLVAYTGDDSLVARANEAFNSAARYYYRGSKDGYRVLQNDHVVSWRNNYTTVRPNYGGGTFGEAVTVLKNPAAMRMAQLFLEDGRGWSWDADFIDVHYMDNVKELFQLASNIDTFEQLPPQPLLPMEEGSPDSAWADEDAGAVSVKRGDSRFYAVLNWRHDSGKPRSPKNAKLSNVARIHYTTDKIDRIANVSMESRGGLYHLYELDYGPYHIRMNLDASETTVAANPALGTYQDLLTGKTYDMTKPNVLPARTTLVLYDESHDTSYDTGKRG